MPIALFFLDTDSRDVGTVAIPVPNGKAGKMFSIPPIKNKQENKNWLLRKKRRPPDGRNEKGTHRA